MPHSVLVLGGTRSGKSEFAEGLVYEATEVRYVATAAPAPDDDPEWAGRIAAHRARRPGHWTTEEIDSPERLAVLLRDVKPDEAVLVDDLGGWLTAVLAGVEWSSTAVEEPVATLVAAVRDCPARTLILVSPEVGLSVVPATAAGRAFVDAAGSANRRLADVCAEVVLVVAGQPTRLKGARPVEAATPPVETAAPPIEPAAPLVEAAAVSPPIEPQPLGDGSGMGLLADRLAAGLPLPSDSAVTAVEERLAALDVPGAGLGRLARAVTFTAGARGSADCHPYREVRALVVHGAHEGGVAAGDDPGTWEHRVRQLSDGDGPIGLLATRAGVRLTLVDVHGALGSVVAGPIEDGDAMPASQVDAALRQGWEIAEAAVDEGADLLILAAAGPGQEAAAAAVVAGSASAEPAALLQRVYRPGGTIDDDAWMSRCAAIRDALRRLRDRSRDAPALLSALGGPDIAVAAGIVLGAASRRTPVVIDGPVGIASALVARDLAGAARLWTVLADHNDHPAVKAGASALDLRPLVKLRLGLGEGAAGLAAVPLIQAALSIAALPIEAPPTTPLPIAAASAVDSA